jgi:hypothetical protein
MCFATFSWESRREQRIQKFGIHVFFCGRRATTCVIALQDCEAKVFEIIAVWKLCNEDCEDIYVWVMTKSPFWMLEEQMRRIWNFSEAMRREVSFFARKFI